MLWSFFVHIKLAVVYRYLNSLDKQLAVGEYGKEGLQ